MLFGLFGSSFPQLGRWFAALGGAAIILLAPAAARSMVTSVELTEEGVTGPGFLGPVHIPWAEVIRVLDDAHGVIVQSATRSTRIDLSTVSISSPLGSTQIANFENPDEIVTFILAHAPKSSILEMRYWLPG